VKLIIAKYNVQRMFLETYPFFINFIILIATHPSIASRKGKEKSDPALLWNRFKYFCNGMKIIMNKKRYEIKKPRGEPRTGLIAKGINPCCDKLLNMPASTHVVIKDLKNLI